MPDFRYSPRPNRADAIHWRPWSGAAFEESRTTQRPILLCVTTVWCEACHELDEQTLSDDRVIERLNQELIPIRVDGDRYPHVQDRYIDAGWPTVALLAPTGEVFWSSTFLDARELVRVIDGVLEAWTERREALEQEIQARRMAIESARSRRSATGLVRREAADDVLTGAQDQFDARNGGFGQAPKFIHAEAVELLLTQGEALPNPDWVTMAERTLDGMLAGEIEDARAGGFFHYALEPDWTRPQTEKLLTVNARALSAFAFGAARRDRADWKEAAERTVAWADDTLARDGLWAGSQLADPDYYGSPDGTDGRDPPPVDDTVYTAGSAMWVAALAGAGRWLGRDDWVRQASAGLDTLLASVSEPGECLAHWRGGEPPVTGLLIDLLHAARAAVAVGEAAGRDDALEEAVRLAGIMRDSLWDDAGGFVDHVAGPNPLGALRYPERPFEENALAARLHILLAERTGDRSHRGVAERILAFLAPYAGRYAVEGATFAMAVEEFFALRR